jgi:diguanylate cyclase (GGDEF)-like protein
MKDSAAPGDYWKGAALNKQHAKHISKDKLHSLLLLKDVEPARELDLLNDCPIICLEPDDILLAQGQPNRNCYCILSGSLRIHLDSLDTPPVSILHAGESVGEISLLDGQHASAHVVCHSNCQLLVMTEDIFWSLVNVSHSFSRNLLFTTIGRLRNSNISVSESFKKQREYKLTAIVDELTGLYNRRWLNKMLDRQMKRSQFSKEPLSLLMIDIDHFKKINDTHGHLVGDQVLRTAAKLMLNSIRPTDMISRYGGEEFAVVLPNTDLAGSRLVAKRILKMVSSTKMVTPEEKALPRVTVSIGIAQMHSHENMADLVRDADKALYRAKENGRNRIEG